MYDGRALPAPRNRRGRGARRGRGGALGATLKLGFVFVLLVGVNVYVLFLRRDTSLTAVLHRNAVPPQAKVVPPGERVPAAPPAAREPPAAGETRLVEGAVAPGEAFREILARLEAPKDAADALVRALHKEIDFRALRPGVGYRFELDAEDTPVALDLRLSPIETVVVRADGDGYRVERHREELATETVAMGGVIERSLYDSVEAAGEDTSIISPFVDVFAWDLDFYTDQHPGDRFQIVAEKRLLRGAFYDYGRIAAAEYAGKAGLYRAFWFEDGGGRRGGYYDEKGQSLERSLLKTPLKYVRISSRFGRRFHPILHRWKGHMGTDFAAPEGTPVRAAAPGRVAFAGKQGGSGNMVALAHDGGLTTLYMHLSRFAKGLRAGQRVDSRQVIAYVGMTGLATGPHLHFAVRKDGSYVDPMRLRAARGRSLQGPALERFRSEIRGRIDALAAIETNAPVRQAARGVSATR